MTRVAILLAACTGCHLVYPHAPPRDAGPPADRSRDAGPSVDRSKDADSRGPDTGPLCGTGQVRCGGACVDATTCAACPEKLLCKPRRACVASCTSCSDPVECYACTTDQTKPIGTCEPAGAGSFCLSGDYSKAYNGSAGEHCDCSDTKVSNCLGSQHVCIPAPNSTDWCVTCGEAGLTTHGLPCKGTGTCDTTLTPPRCK